MKKGCIIWQILIECAFSYYYYHYYYYYRVWANFNENPVHGIRCSMTWPERVEEQCAWRRLCSEVYTPGKKLARYYAILLFSCPSLNIRCTDWRVVYTYCTFLRFGDSYENITKNRRKIVVTSCRRGSLEPNLFFVHRVFKREMWFFSPFNFSVDHEHVITRPAWRRFRPGLILRSERPFVTGFSAYTYKLPIPRYLPLYIRVHTVGGGGGEFERNEIITKTK